MADVAPARPGPASRSGERTSTGEHVPLPATRAATRALPAAASRSPPPPHDTAEPTPSPAALRTRPRSPFAPSSSSTRTADATQGAPPRHPGPVAPGEPGDASPSSDPSAPTPVQQADPVPPATETVSSGSTSLPMWWQGKQVARAGDDDDDGDEDPDDDDPRRPRRAEDPPSLTASIFSTQQTLVRQRLWTIAASVGINLVLPFVNGVMLGFGELFAREYLALWFGFGPAATRQSATTQTPQRGNTARVGLHAANRTGDMPGHAGAKTAAEAAIDFARAST